MWIDTCSTTRMTVCEITVLVSSFSPVKRFEDPSLEESGSRRRSACIGYRGGRERRETNWMRSMDVVADSRIWGRLIQDLDVADGYTI